MAEMEITSKGAFERIRSGLEDALRAAGCSHGRLVDVPGDSGALVPKAARSFCPDCGCYFTAYPTTSGEMG